MWKFFVSVIFLGPHWLIQFFSPRLIIYCSICIKQSSYAPLSQLSFFLLPIVLSVGTGSGVILPKTTILTVRYHFSKANIIFFKSGITERVRPLKAHKMLGSFFNFDFVFGLFRLKGEKRCKIELFTTHSGFSYFKIFLRNFHKLVAIIYTKRMYVKISL